VATELTCPVSCVTNGQRVPDDLHQATGPFLVELVLGKEE
jgi:flagellar biosynthesis GTPase FlhF